MLTHAPYHAFGIRQTTRRGISALKEQWETNTWEYQHLSQARERLVASGGFPNSHISYSLWDQSMQQCNAPRRDCNLLRAASAVKEKCRSSTSPCCTTHSSARRRSPATEVKQDWEGSSLIPCAPAGASD